MITEKDYSSNEFELDYPNLYDRLSGAMIETTDRYVSIENANFIEYTFILPTIEFLCFILCLQSLSCHFYLFDSELREGSFILDSFTLNERCVTGASDSSLDREWHIKCLVIQISVIDGPVLCVSCISDPQCRHRGVMS